jgi:hypothetical protein
VPDRQPGNPVAATYRNPGDPGPLLTPPLFGQYDDPTTAAEAIGGDDALGASRG